MKSKVNNGKLNSIIYMVNKLLYDSNSINPEGKLLLLPIYYVHTWWHRSITALGVVLTHVKRIGVSCILWGTNSFTTTLYPTPNTVYGRLYKAKIKLECGEYYNVENYDKFFDSIWGNITELECTPKDMISTVMKMNLILISYSALTSMCGIQPITNSTVTGDSKVFTLRCTNHIGLGDSSQLVLEVLSHVVNEVNEPLPFHWTPDLIHDLNSYNGLDIGDEIIKATVLEVNSVHVRNFCGAVLGSCKNVILEAFDPPPSDDDAFYQIICELKSTSKEINTTTGRGVGNVLWVSPHMLSLLQKYAIRLGSFIPTSVPTEGYNSGVELVGVLEDKIKVYCTELLPNGIDGIMGYKGGSGEVDAGYIHAPVVPISVSEYNNQGGAIFASKYGTHAPSPDDTSSSSWHQYYRTLSINFNPADYTDHKINIAVCKEKSPAGDFL